MRQMAEVLIGKFDAVLFDMDGTLVNSFNSIESAWQRWSEHHTFDAEAVIASMHGLRAIDAIRKHLPSLTEAQYEAEARAIDSFEIDAGIAIPEIPGAARLLRSLPANRWAITTSADRTMAKYRVTKAGLPLPTVLTAGEDVEHGKPHPAGYLLSSKLLGVPIDRCLVFEDTRVGLQAGLAAGATVVSVGNRQASNELAVKRIIQDYRNVEVEYSDSEIHVFIEESQLSMEG